MDVHGDLLIANGGGSSGSDYGNLACVPAGAIATGDNTSTTVTQNVDYPTGLAYDSRDGSVALANGPVSAPMQLAEYSATGNYTVCSSTRTLTVSGFGSLGDGVVISRRKPPERTPSRSRPAPSRYQSRRDREPIEDRDPQPDRDGDRHHHADHGKLLRSAEQSDRYLHGADVIRG